MSTKKLLLNEILVLFLLVQLLNLKPLLGQGNHTLSFGIEPYNYILEEKKGVFNNKFFSLLPTFKYAYHTNKFNVFAQHTVAIWRLNNFKNESEYLYYRLFKTYSIGIEKSLFSYKKLSLKSGSSISYLFGGDIHAYYDLEGPEILYTGAGIDFFASAGIEYMKGLSINPTFNFHLNPKKKYNMLTFIVLFGFDF